jgi:hypothetical protein
MRPVMAALQEQQQVLGGLRHEAAKTTAQHRQAFSTLRALAQRQAAQIDQLTRGIQAIAQAAGIEQHVVTAMTRRADVQNPAQPVPEPPAEPSVHPTQEAKTPEAFADVNAPGLVPGSTNDVAADAASTVYTPGDDIPGPAVKELVDVTRPVDGTQTPRPLSEVRTETDVRVGDPMNPQVGFPLRGDFQNAQRLGSKNDGRTMAAIRLAKLRIATGTAQGVDVEVAGEIEKDASLSTDAIEREIVTLTQVSKAAAKTPRNLVPKAASVSRTVPSLAATASASGSSTDTEDADLFL